MAIVATHPSSLGLRLRESSDEEKSSNYLERYQFCANNDNDDDDDDVYDGIDETELS